MAPIAVDLRKYSSTPKPLANLRLEPLPRHPTCRTPYQLSSHKRHVNTSYNGVASYLYKKQIREKLSRQPLDAVWKAAQVEESEDVRNFLMEKYLPLVERMVNIIGKRLPSTVEKEDLFSAGIFGLMDAIKKYDTSRNVKFLTYASERIKGAIRDELRSMDWVPRLVRYRTAQAEAIREEFRLRTGLEPADEEIAARLGITVDEFYKTKTGQGESIRKDSMPVQLVSLTPRMRSSEYSRRGPYLTVTDYDPIANSHVSSLRAEANRKYCKELIFKGLSGSERLVVLLYYYEGLRMKDVAETLGLSESRVSQMHSAILERLKEREGLESCLREAISA